MKNSSRDANTQFYKYNLIADGVKYEAVGRRNMRENVETHGVRLRRAGKPAEIYRPFLRDATFGRRSISNNRMNRIYRTNTDSLNFRFCDFFCQIVIGVIVCSDD
jgi:hypothetical protein